MAGHGGFCQGAATFSDWLYCPAPSPAVPGKGPKHGEQAGRPGGSREAWEGVPGGPQPFGNSRKHLRPGSGSGHGAFLGRSSASLDGCKAWPWGLGGQLHQGQGIWGGGYRLQPACLSSSPSLAANPVIDVLAALQLQKEPEGVRKTPGFCPQRRAGSGPEAAFRISRRAQISAPTRQLFPGTPQGCRWDGGSLGSGSTFAQAQKR